MKLSDKFKYMIIGAVIALARFGLGSLVTGIDAQNKFATFDSIYTKHIRVSDSIAVGDAKEPDILIITGDHGGIIQIYDKNSKACVGLGIDELGGKMHVSPSDGEGSIVLCNVFGPGTLLATSNDNKGGVSFSPKGGWLMVRGAHGSVSLTTDTIYGGVVEVTDFAGNEHRLATEK